jgi:hypothetical protein
VKTFLIAHHGNPANHLRVCEVRAIPGQKIIYVMDSGNRDVGSVSNRTPWYCFAAQDRFRKQQRFFRYFKNGKAVDDFHSLPGFIRITRRHFINDNLRYKTIKGFKSIGSPIRCDLLVRGN